ncbi:MAG: NADH-ubiquinone oxidoreductase-F iron-sulfur binding region domain-containing protein [Desulfobacterales bacterium]
MGLFKRRQKHDTRAASGAPAPRPPFGCGVDAAGAFITACAANGACRCGADAVRRAIEEEIRACGLSVRIAPMKVGCSGACPYGPLAGFPGGGFFYHRLTPDRAREAVFETLAKGHILFDLIHLDPLQTTSGRFLYDHGSRCIALLDENRCMVQVAKYFLDFDRGVSCGKCTPCRAGFPYLRELIEAIAAGEGQPEDLQTMEAVMAAMRAAAYCEYAGRGAGPVATILEYFRPEFERHIHQKECPAGECRRLGGQIPGMNAECLP